MAGFDPISMAIGAGSDLFKTFYGLEQMITGNNKLDKLNQNRPQYQVDPNIQYNAQLAGQLASEGLPSSTKNFYGDQIERGLGSTITATLQGGGGLGYVNNAYQSSTDAFRQLLSMDAQQKLQNSQILMGAKKDLRDENLQAWNYNVNVPFQQQWNRYTNQTNSGAQNIFGGGQGLGADTLGLWDAFGNNKGGGGGNIG